MTKEERIEIINNLKKSKQDCDLGGGICVSKGLGDITTFRYVKEKLSELAKTKRFFYSFENEDKSKYRTGKYFYFWEFGKTLGRVRFLNKLIKELEDDNNYKRNSLRAEV